MQTAQQISNKLVECFKKGGKVFIVGNGGSATLASHFVGELQGKFLKKRSPLPAISLFDLASITAISNDLGYSLTFSRPLQSLGKPEDILITLSTSGKSKNILNAIKVAKKMNIGVIDFPRKGRNTPRIQEFQLRLMHDVCELTEEEMFP